jgi:hypothetical protein
VVKVEEVEVEVEAVANPVSFFRNPLNANDALLGRGKQRGEIES